MKLVLGLSAIIASVGISSAALADKYVNGYYRSNGTYVQPHYRSNSDGNSYNNYSSKGNYNPYTGQKGTRTPGYDQGESGSSLYGSSRPSNSGSFNSNY